MYAFFFGNMCVLKAIIFAAFASSELIIATSALRKSYLKGVVGQEESMREEYEKALDFLYDGGDDVLVATKVSRVISSLAGVGLSVD